MEGSQSEPRIDEILSNLSSHLDMLAGHIFDVEAALGGIVDNENSAEKMSITRLQALDFTRQSLEDCALLVEAISKDPGLAIFLQDVKTLSRKPKLAATKTLLRNGMQKSQSTSDGEVDFF